MYMGISAHHNAKRVKCYSDAVAVFQAMQLTPTGRTRQPNANGMFPLGLTKRGRTQVGEAKEGGIAFRLYDTDVVTWYPDNSIIIENFGTVTTAGFAAHFLPGRIHLRHPVERRDVCGGDKGITYVGPDGWRICFGQGDTVRFVPEGEHWVPDEETLRKVVFPVLDRADARRVAQDYHLKDFETWLAVAPFHLELEHAYWNLSLCREALSKRDFAAAAAHLPTIKETSSWGGRKVNALPIACTYQHHVTMGSLEKLKLALWEDEGAFQDSIHLSMSQTEFERGMARVRQLDALDFNFGYGPNA